MAVTANNSSDRGVLLIVGWLLNNRSMSTWSGSCRTIIVSLVTNINRWIRVVCLLRRSQLISWWALHTPVWSWCILLVWSITAVWWRSSRAAGQVSCHCWISHAISRTSRIAWVVCWCWRVRCSTTVVMALTISEDSWGSSITIVWTVSSVTVRRSISHWRHLSRWGNLLLFKSINTRRLEWSGGRQRLWPGGSASATTILRVLLSNS